MVFSVTNWHVWLWFQFSSVAQSCPTLCNPMNHSTPGLPVHHQLPKSTHTHVYWVGDAIQQSHPLSPLLLLPSVFPSIRIFSSESVLHIRWPKYWSFSFIICPPNEYSGMISFRTDFLYSPSIDCLLCILNSMAQQVKNPPAMQESQETQVPSLG